jgi:hypothetical protein
MPAAWNATELAKKSENPVRPVALRRSDTKLDRKIAVKVLPGATGGDPEHRRRFDREARMLPSGDRTGASSDPSLRSEPLSRSPPAA